MAITLNQPNTIHLAGPVQEVGDLACGVAICPGHLVERYNPSGTIIRLRPHTTGGGATMRLLAVEQSDVNKGVNDGYAIGDLVQAKAFPTGSSAWALIASGQNIVAGNKLESAGDGTLRILASGVALFSAIESVNNTTGNAGPTNPPPQTGGTTSLPVGAARIRVEAL